MGHRVVVRADSRGLGENAAGGRRPFSAGTPGCWSERCRRFQERFSVVRRAAEARLFRSAPGAGEAAPGGKFLTESPPGTAPREGAVLVWLLLLSCDAASTHPCTRARCVREVAAGSGIQRTRGRQGRAVVKPPSGPVLTVSVLRRRTAGGASFQQRHLHTKEKINIHRSRVSENANILKKIRPFSLIT